MALTKGIQHGKEHRKRYYGSKAFDSSCRNHGSCSWCRSNRLIKDMRAALRMELAYAGPIEGGRSAVTCNV